MKDRDIKANIEKLRKLKGISQENMADTLNMDRNTYRSIEKGKTKILNSNLEGIANVLGTSVDEIVLGYKLEANNITLLEDNPTRLHQILIENDKRVKDLQREIVIKNNEIEQLNTWLADKDKIIHYLYKELDTYKSKLNKTK